MVIAERFAWAHLPKSGGDATYAMFSAIPGLVRFADPPQSQDKHLPFFARSDDVAGKLLVMNIRRLPAWTLSGAHHRAKHGLYPDYRPQPLQSADEMTSTSEADDLLVWMTDHGRFRIDRWLRAETLEHDVVALLAEVGFSTPEARRLVHAVGRVNEASYERDPFQRFTREQMRRLYAINPIWAGIERRLYGSLLAESPGVTREGPDLDR